MNKHTLSVIVFAIIYLIILANLAKHDDVLIKPRRQQIVTIKNNGQEIVYYVDGKRVILGYEDKE